MFVLQGSMLCLLLRGLNNSWIIDSVYTIKKHAYPVIMSVQTAGPEHGPCSIEKKIVSVNTVGNCTPVVVMGLEQQPDGTRTTA